MDFPNKNIALASLVVLGLSTGFATDVQAFSPEGDLMKIKGYSPEEIQATLNQRSRQEWREPSASSSSPLERFFHNVYYGNWTNDTDEFGAAIIRGE